MAQINFFKTNPVNIQVPYEGYVSMFYSDQDTLSFLNSTGSLYPTVSGYVATSSVAFKAVDLTPGNKQLNGNFTLTGSHTAQSYTVANQVFNKQVISPSGSTIFGAYVDSNTHQFTGSFSSTGSSQFKGNMIISGTLTVSGNVLLPSKPAFRIYGTGGTRLAPLTYSGSDVVVDFNQGSHFNQSTGIFTAPQTGLYQINFTVRTGANNNNTINQAAVIKNSGGTETNQVMLEFAVNTSMNHSGGSSVSRLLAGDTLRAVILQGTCSFDGNNNFSVAFLG